MFLVFISKKWNLSSSVSTSLLKMVSLSALQIALELLYLGVLVLTTSQALSIYKFCFFGVLTPTLKCNIEHAILFVIFKFHFNN